MKFSRTKTCRGFTLIQFRDAYDVICDIQQSSLITPHIWVGTSDSRMHLNRKQSLIIGIKLIVFGLFGRI